MLGLGLGLWLGLVVKVRIGVGVSGRQAAETLRRSKGCPSSGSLQCSYQHDAI